MNDDLFDLSDDVTDFSDFIFCCCCNLYVDMPPAAQPRPAVHARKRRRVKKTYTNDEGYMVTEIVWESESDNDDIAATAPPAATRAPPLSTTTTATAASKPKDPVPKKPISKKVSGTATKKEAASFMSFFKKK